MKRMDKEKVMPENSRPPCLISMSRHNPAAPWRIGPARHPVFEMLVLYRGRHACDIDGQAFRSGPGDVVLFHPGATHTEFSGADGVTEWLCFSFEWEDAPRDLPASGPDERGRIRILAEWMWGEYGEAGPGPDPLCDSLLHALLAEFYLSRREREPELVRRVRRTIRDRLHEPLRLVDLAAAVHLSKYHFAREYRKLTGRSPMADVRQIRLARARDLVLGTDLPMKTIAARTGLGDHQALARLFRKAFGLPPSAFRGGVPKDVKEEG